MPDKTWANYLAKLAELERHKGLTRPTPIVEPITEMLTPVIVPAIPYTVFIEESNKTQQLLSDMQAERAKTRALIAESRELARHYFSI